MSAFPDRPTDLTEWARGTGLDLDGTEFLPRMLYARYLRESLAAAWEGAGRLRRRQARATAILSSGDGHVIPLTDDGWLDADDVVLATGNGVAPLGWLPDAPGVIRDPWAPGALDDLASDARVAIVGSGLSAVDAVLSLRDMGHAGAVTMISSHGMLPQPHLAEVLPTRAPAIGPGAGLTVRGLVRALRADAATADDWRQTIDAVRPATVATWRALPASERKRALRHVLRRWEVRRHRMAPQVAAALDRQRATGRLTVIPGRVRGVDRMSDGLAVLVDHAGRSKTSVVDAVIACVGPSADPLHDVLLRDTIDAGSLARHALGLGLDVDDIGRARRSDGSLHAHVWTVGSLRKGADWEATAVPELRQHAAAIAEMLTSD
jgi:uncharacterized NAD(P)/FAD-binding protein YdhS